MPELLKPGKTTKEVAFGDVTFAFRTELTAGDKFDIDTAGFLNKDGAISIKPLELYRKVVETFVVGWKGVTEGGKDAAYSFAKLSLLPVPADGQDLIFKLGVHIAGELGLIDKAPEDGSKNV